MLLSVCDLSLLQKPPPPIIPLPKKVAPRLIACVPVLDYIVRLRDGSGRAVGVGQKQITQIKLSESRARNDVYNGTPRGAHTAARVRCDGLTVRADTPPSINASRGVSTLAVNRNIIAYQRTAGDAFFLAERFVSPTATCTALVEL